jgi:hypothetical protein
LVQPNFARHVKWLLLGLSKVGSVTIFTVKITTSFERADIWFTRTLTAVEGPFLLFCRYKAQDLCQECFNFEKRKKCKIMTGDSLSALLLAAKCRHGKANG